LTQIGGGQKKGGEGSFTKGGGKREKPQIFCGTENKEKTVKKEMFWVLCKLHHPTGGE